MIFSASVDELSSFVWIQLCLNSCVPSSGYECTTHTHTHIYIIGEQSEPSVGWWMKNFLWPRMPVCRYMCRTFITQWAEECTVEFKELVMSYLKDFLQVASETAEFSWSFVDKIKAMQCWGIHPLLTKIQFCMKNQFHLLGITWCTHSSGWQGGMWHRMLKPPTKHMFF